MRIIPTDLGNRLRNWAGQHDFMWRGYIEELYELCGGLADLEQIMTELHERPVGSRAAALTMMHCGNTVGGLRVAIPEYFNALRQESLQSADLYGTLARDHVQDGDAILTFNYDLACEQALKRNGLSDISDGDGNGFELGLNVIPSSKAKLLTLHGSTNWLGILFRGSTGYFQPSKTYDHRPAVIIGRNDSVFFGYPDSVRDPCGK
jgi:hypothetical protein